GSSAITPFKMGAIISRSLIFMDEIPVSTGGELDVVDITGQVRRLISESGISDGLAHVFVAGSTAALTTIEYEPGAVADLQEAFSRLIPGEIEYAHNARWGDGNGHSHVRAAMLGPDITVPVRDGSPLLGTWQQIILVEFDTRSRNRKVNLTIMGEGAIKEA
ncbi:MAG TPA: secondary thiamine-phosphate synthase enzyme YjbQ, partial [Nitrospiria bacterium]|nr:secondary thiamine-phosphate synthase enzyme YjbQ [Nitrospiria bacterium]